MHCSSLEAVGLDEVTANDFLDTGIKQVQYLGNKLIEYGIPIQQPIGGNAVFVDAKKFLPYVPKEAFSIQNLISVNYSWWQLIIDVSLMTTKTIE